ncbi:MAG: hypothetical protein JWR32_192 [Mycobacterium sp.]|nr:hypothetical protein [Mycobacterium sp.]
MGRALYGRWTFQIVEEFDDNYWSRFRQRERRVRDELQQGVRHVFEAEMKERRRTHGLSGDEGRPWSHDGHERWVRRCVRVFLYVRELVITQNITLDGSIEMLDDWFDPQPQDVLAGDPVDAVRELKDNPAATSR